MTTMAIWNKILIMHHFVFSVGFIRDRTEVSNQIFWKIFLVKTIAKLDLLVHDSSCDKKINTFHSIL